MFSPFSQNSLKEMSEILRFKNTGVYMCSLGLEEILKILKL